MKGESDAPPGDKAPETDVPAPGSALADALRVAGVLALFAGAAWLLHSASARGDLPDVTRWREQFQGHQGTGLLFFVAVVSLLTGIGMPRIWACALAGGLYGAAIGSVVGHVATVLGSVLSFAIGRLLLRGPLARRGGRRYSRWSRALQENGFRWILMARLFPIGNATAVNLVCGASRTRLRDFIAGTFLGYLPLTVAFATLGSSAAKNHRLQLVLAAVILLAIVVLRRSRFMSSPPREAQIP